MWCSWCVHADRGRRMEPSSWPAHFRNRTTHRRDWRFRPDFGEYDGSRFRRWFLELKSRCGVFLQFEVGRSRPCAACFASPRPRWQPRRRRTSRRKLSAHRIQNRRFTKRDRAPRQPARARKSAARRQLNPNALNRFRKPSFESTT